LYLVDKKLDEINYTQRQGMIR